MRKANVCIIGAGQVGTAAAAAITAQGLADVSLIDNVAGLSWGKAMDINHARPLLAIDCNVAGYDDFRGLVGADVVVLTAGAPRQAGQSRDDLLAGNLSIALEAGRQVLSRCPQAVMLVVTNPVDALTWALRQRLDKLNVLGLGCCLDAARLRFFLAEAAGLSVSDVYATVVGSHNDAMVPVLSQATIGGLPARQVLSEDQLAQAARRTRSAGADIVAALRTRGSFYAAAQTIVAIVRAIVHDTGAVFPVSVPSAGAVGHEELCLALPAEVHARGIGRVLPLSLSGAEQAAWEACCDGMSASLVQTHRLLETCLAME